MAEPTIMVVEDNVSLLEGLKDLLESTGYRVEIAENGGEALELLEDVKPDLIISDIMMPRLDGYEFQARVREKPELLGVPFIFLTAKGGRDDIRLGKDLGADDYITKPFDEEDLLVAVRSKLSRWGDLKKVQDEQIAGIKQNILLTMSHEFRTPLSYILNYAEMLDENYETIAPEDFRLFMKGIQKGAARLNRLVEDFILLVELETGEAEKAYQIRRREVADLGAWLRVTCRRFEDDAGARGLNLILDIPDQLPVLVVDEYYLANALGRIVENAIKFSKSTSEWVRVMVNVTDEALRISVQDQGIGIPEEEMESLFNIFHQIDRAKYEQQGIGSGLAMCQRIVSIHGGSVSVESEHDVGTVITIELPFEAASG
ncbi:MAG: response regulator [Anaerolineales bacterium]